MSESSCRGCWWQEGGRCYVEPCEREGGGKSGRSVKLAAQRCDQYAGKRAMLSQMIPDEKLVITSEQAPTAQDLTD